MSQKVLWQSSHSKGNLENDGEIRQSQAKDKWKCINLIPAGLEIEYN